MDDLSYYDDTGALPLFADSGQPIDGFGNTDPYAGSYFAPAAPDPVYQGFAVAPVDNTVAFTPVATGYDPGIDPLYQDFTAVPADTIAVITPVAISYDPGPVFALSEPPADAVYAPVYVDPVVPLIPSFAQSNYVLDGTHGSIPQTVIDFHPGDQVILLGYENGLDSWGFLGDSGGSCACPTVVGSLDGGTASFAVTLSGLSAFDGLSVSAGNTPDGTGYLQLTS